MALSTERFCVNGIACSLSLHELTLQGGNARHVLNKALPKRSLALQKTARGLLSLLAETSQTVTASCSGFASLLSATQGHTLLHNAFRPLGVFLSVFLLKLCQLLTQITNGFLLLAHFAFGDFHLGLGFVPLSLPRAVGHMLVGVAIVGVQIGAVDQVTDTPLVVRPTTAM
jgi:hypothetical protein